MQVAQRTHPGWITAVLMSLGLLIACGDGGRDAERTSEASPDVEAADAAAHLRSLYFAQDYRTAMEEGELLLTRFPQAPELAAWQALSLARAGEPTKARTLADELLARHPDSSWSRFALGAALMWDRESDRVETLDATAKAYAADPVHHDFVWLRAESLRLSGDKDGAVAFLEAHTTLLNASPHLLNVKGAALFDLALADSSDDAKRLAALAASAEARRLDPDNVNANYEPGWFLLVLGRPAEAYPMLKTAATLSRARLVQHAYWSSIVRRTDLTLAEKRAEVDASVSRLTDSPGISLDLLPVAANMYKEVGLRARQKDLEARVLANHPQSRSAEEVLMGRITDLVRDGATDRPQFRDSLREFLAREPIHEPMNLQNAQLWLFYALREDPDSDAAELRDLVLSISRHEGATRSTAYSEGAAALASRKVYLEEAERLAKEGLAAAKTSSEPERLPDQVGPREAAMRDALGWVYFNQGRVEDAETELLAAYELAAHNASVLLHLAELYEAREEYERAETFFIRCAALPMQETHPCAYVLHDYYVRRHGSDDGYDAYLDTIRDRLIAASKIRVEESALPQPEVPPPFSLTSIDGRPVSLGDLHGKLAIVKFWAVWCAPCRVEMPPFADFTERFADVPDVEIVTISFDPNPETVRHWLQENDLTFEVLVDDGYGRTAGVGGIPRTWFLDAEGRVVFDLLGVTDDLENEYVARLDSLRRWEGE